MIKDNVKIKYFLYARKSSESEDRQVQSIDDQVNGLKKLANDLRLDIVEVYSESKSAKKPNNRPLFDEMIQRIERGEGNGILSWHINRLSRNPIDSGKLSWMLQQGVLKSIQTMEKQYLPDDNVILFNVETGSANQYILDLSKAVRRGIDGKLKKGWRPGSAPQGYLNSKFKDRGDNDIAIDPERFPLIRKMWDLMLTGNYAVPKILEIANNEWGYKTRQCKRMGGKPLGRSSLYRIFTNVFYAGTIEHLGQQYEGKHDKMITLEEYDRVQILLGREGKPRPKTHEFPFTGIIHCGECGCIITAADKIKIIKGSKEIRQHTYYYCTRRKKNIKCSQKEYITKEDLEIKIEKELEKYEIMPEFLHWALERIREKNKTDFEDKIKFREMQQKTLEQTESQLKELVGMRYKMLIGDEIFLKEKPELEKKIAQLREKLATADDTSERLIELTEKTFKFATYARKAFMSKRWEPKRELLTTLGEKPIIRGEKLTIEPYEWFEVIQKGYPALKEEYLRWEPIKKGKNRGKTEALASISTRWRGQGDLNPRSPP